MVSTFAAGGTADVLTRHRRRASVGDLQAAVLRRDPRRRRRHDRREVRSSIRRPTATTSRSPTSRIWCCIRSAIRSSATIRQARSHQHRPIVGGLADRAVGQRQGRRQDAQGIHRAGQQDRKPLTYSSSGVGSSGQLVGENFANAGRHQDRARALQGRIAGPDRPGRRPHRLLGADRVVDRGAGSRRHSFARIAHSGASAAAGLSRTCRPSRSWATTSSPPSGSHCPVRRICRKDITEKVNARSTAAVQRRRSRRGCGGTA